MQCPLCNGKGEPLFVGFQCETINCLNYNASYTNSSKTKVFSSVDKALDEILAMYEKEPAMVLWAADSPDFLHKEILCIEKYEKDYLPTLSVFSFKGTNTTIRISGKSDTLINEIAWDSVLYTINYGLTRVGSRKEMMGLVKLS